MLDLKPVIATYSNFPSEILVAMRALMAFGTIKSMRIKLRDTPPAHSFNSQITFDLFDDEYGSHHSLTWGDVTKGADPCHILYAQERLLMGEAALSVITSQTLETIMSQAVPHRSDADSALYLQVFEDCIIASSDDYGPYMRGIKYLDPVDKEELAQTLCTVITPVPESNHATVAMTRHIETALKFWHFDPPHHMTHPDLDDICMVIPTETEIAAALSA